MATTQIDYHGIGEKLLNTDELPTWENYFHGLGYDAESIKCIITYGFLPAESPDGKYYVALEYKQFDTAQQAAKYIVDNKLPVYRN